MGNGSVETEKFNVPDTVPTWLWKVARSLWHQHPQAKSRPRPQEFRSFILC